MRKGQYYMFAGILLISLTFGAFANKSKLAEPQNTDATNYLRNYKTEASVIINNAVYANKNVSYELRNFTEAFIEYGTTKDNNFEILYMYSEDDTIYITSYLTGTATLVDQTMDITPNSEVAIDYVSRLSVGYLGETYSFTFNPGKEFRVLFVGD